MTRDPLWKSERVAQQMWNAAKKQVRTLERAHPVFTPLRASHLQTTPPFACPGATACSSKASPSRATRTIPLVSPTPALLSESLDHPADVRFPSTQRFFGSVVTCLGLFYLIAGFLAWFWCTFTAWWQFFCLTMKKRCQYFMTSAFWACVSVKTSQITSCRNEISRKTIWKNAICENVKSIHVCCTIVAPQGCSSALFWKHS